MLIKNKNISEYLPKSSLDILNQNIKYGKTVTSISSFEKEIIYTLRKMTLSEIENLQDVNEGLEHLIKNTADSCNNLEDLINSIKSKRYTRSRIQRILLYALLNITKKDINPDESSDYKEGIIIDQSIKAGEKLSEGSSITLYIPKLDNKYPDFVSGDYSITEVEDFCDEYGVVLTKKEVETNDYPAGSIIYQSRAAGSTVVSGAKLTINIAVAPSDGNNNPDDGDLN